MARRGENIYKRKDKRWEGRFLKGYNSDGKAQLGYVYAKSYREVREKLAVAKQETSKNIGSNQQNLSHFFDEWLLLCRNRVKASTYVKYHTTINRHLKPNLGQYLPQKMHAVLIEDFSNTLLKSGLSVKTVRDILTILK